MYTATVSYGRGAHKHLGQQFLEALNRLSGFENAYSLLMPRAAGRKQIKEQGRHDSVGCEGEYSIICIQKQTVNMKKLVG